MILISTDLVGLPGKLGWPFCVWGQERLGIFIEGMS